MQQAVLRHFPDVKASYRFTHRDQGVYFTKECYESYIQSLARELFSSTWFWALIYHCRYCKIQSFYKHFSALLSTIITFKTFFFFSLSLLSMTTFLIRHSLLPRSQFLYSKRLLFN